MNGSQERLLLAVLGSDQAPAELPRSGMLAVGSSPEKAGLLVEGQGVAEVHCAIGRTKAGGFAIRDLGSEYGTLLNGTRISQSRLELGDEILIGSIRLKIVAAGELGGTSTPANTAPAKTSPRRRTPSPMPRIEGYKLQQLLGKGSMGEVYLAVQVSLDREVALKVLSKKHEEDQAFVASFQAEARSAAALNHPNVVTVHDVGEQDGVHYLTMEYMDRSSLEERVLREGPLPWTLVLEVLKDSASGLVYAESRGIVHRDIKPANLMQNHSGTTKIADLGLATSITSEDAIEGDRKIFGTPHFISPEQIKGEKADCRSDLYSLGSTAYRLLTGHTPYEGQNTRAILRDKLRGEHVPIGERVSDVPPALVALVERLMRLDPADRFPSATALLRELERLQSQGAESLEASPVGASRSLRAGLLLGLAALVVVALVLVFGDSGPPPTPAHAGLDGNGGAGQELNLQPDPEPLLPIPGLPPAEQDATQADNDLADNDLADNDLQEQLFEQGAENAFLRLGQQDLAPAERSARLRELSREYLGTTAATAAIAEAARIEQELRTSAEAVGRHDAAMTEIFVPLEAAAKLEDKALRPGQALRAMAAIEGLEAFAGDDAFSLRRAALESRVIATALEQFAGVMQEIESLEQAGDFERARQVMTDLLGRTDLPAFETGRRPSRVDEVEALANHLRTRLEGLDAQRLTFQAERDKRDRERTGQALGPASGFLEELAQLDFGAASERFARLNRDLQSAPAQARAQALAQRLELAGRALPILSRGIGNWRRKTISNPAEKRSPSREVQSVSTRGVVLKVAGQPQEVAWAEFGGHTKALHTLFSKRLKRPYGSDEAQAIAALMHFSALCECLQKASEMFEPAGQAVFTAAEAEALPQPFELALGWCRSDSERELVLRDQAASRLLGQALAHGSQDAWTSAVSELEELYRRYADSWVVRLLSDGRPLTLPE